MSAPMLDDEQDDYPSQHGDEPAHVDLVDTSRPLTRDLAKIIESAYIVEAELRHQLRRINPDRARTDSERAHLQGLKNGYGEAFHNVRVLRRYHEGRIHRQRASGDTAPAALAQDGTGTQPVFNRDGDDPHA